MLLPATVALLAGCGVSSHPAPTTGIPQQLLREARPIGAGPRFHPPPTGPISGACRPAIGTHYAAHVEVFARNRVVIVPAGIGTRPPRTRSAGRITRAHCYGDLVTRDPTGVLLVRAGRRPTLSELFRSWGQPLSITRLASFHASPRTRVDVFVNGHRSQLPPDRVPLSPNAEIVLEVGPHVPPHTTYTFPRGA